MPRNLGALFCLLLALSAGALSACNTTAGFGRDVKSTGDAIEDTAEDAAE